MSFTEGEEYISSCRRPFRNKCSMVWISRPRTCLYFSNSFLFGGGELLFNKRDAPCVLVRKVTEGKEGKEGHVRGMYVPSKGLKVRSSGRRLLAAFSETLSVEMDDLFAQK